MRKEKCENEEEAEHMIELPGLDCLEIKQWKIMLRENDISMDEFNLKRKKLETKELEESIERLRKEKEQEIKDRKRILEIQRRQFEEEMKLINEVSAIRIEMVEREQNLLIQREKLRQREMELTEKMLFLKSH